MGLGTNIQPTPAVALGAYEMTPVDVAAGYTTLPPWARGGAAFLRIVVNADGTPLEKFSPQTHLALDPRVAFLVDSLLKDVMNRARRGSPRTRLHSARSRKDRHIARRMVCWIHFQPPLRDLDRLR